MVLTDDVDWDEVGELLTDSYCVPAPKKLVALVDRPDQGVFGSRGCHHLHCGMPATQDPDSARQHWWTDANSALSRTQTIRFRLH